MTKNKETYYYKRPSISFRCHSREEYDKITTMAERAGKSVSRLLREAIMDLEKTESQSYQSGFKNGLKRIYLPCPVCGSTMNFDLNTTEFKVKIEQTFQSYTCNKCGKIAKLQPLYY